MTQANVLAQMGSQNQTFRNRIINGAMVIDQRNAGASVTPANDQFATDRFQCMLTQSSKYTAQQSSTAPAGFINSLLITSSSAYSVAAGDFFGIRQCIEGLNIADLGWGTANAKSVTLSFWVYSSLTGTFGGSLFNSGGNRSYPYSYTINSANTWEQKSITIAGDTSGTWLTTNGKGIQLVFGLGVGSTYSGTAGSWSGSLYISSTGATSVVGTNGATFYITGVQLEAGTSATPFEYRSYGTELALCQRYLPSYIYSAPSGTETVAWVRGGSTSNIASTQIPFQVTARVPPTGATVSGSYAVSGYSFSTLAFNNASTNNASISLSGGSGMTVFYMYELQCSTAGSKILFTGCEL
jgi:hypothetical protein